MAVGESHICIERGRSSSGAWELVIASARTEYDQKMIVVEVSLLSSV